MTQMHEIRLIINQDKDGYTARWIDPGNQESETFPLILPLTANDSVDLRWYLETYYQFPGAGDRARAQGIEAKFKKWGHKLFDAIFGTSEGTHVYRSLMDAVKHDHKCLLTIGTKDQDVLVQPWEMMRDKQGPLAMRGITIRRQLKGIREHKKHELSLPLRVLLIVSRPTDAHFIDPRNSIMPMLDALAAIPDGQVTVDFCDPPTLPQLEKNISQARKEKKPYHIVHFDGHGTYMPKTGVGALAFENEQAKTELVPGTRLGDLLSRLDVPLVLLEACRGSDLSDQPVFGSVAPALLESGVGSVIAFSHSVHVKAARILVERFYQELTGGMSVGQAVEEARSALRADPSRYLHYGPDADSIDLEDWFIPQLYQVGPDLSLVGEDAQASTDEDDTRSYAPQPLPGFPPEPLYKFHGRALEMLELERAFRKHAGVVVSGMGGMGKTALAREAAGWWRRTHLFETAVFCSFEQKAGAERVVQLLGQSLEGDDFGARSSDEQWQRAIDLFHKNRVLMVWDNFESTLPIYQTGEDDGATGSSPLHFDDDARTRLHQLYRELTQGTPKGRILVTCRPEETGLPGIKEYSLKGLKRPDSLHLLAAVLDQKGIDTDRKGYERHEIDALLDKLEDHPLSLALVTPHLKELTPQEIRNEFSRHLEKFIDDSAVEARNKSLLASLAFSKKRLSADAQKALPWLAWFQGGVYEKFFLDFSEMQPETWAKARAELVATALISVEGQDWLKTPYLRFHPTLVYAADAREVPDAVAAEERFMEIYLKVAGTMYNLLKGEQPAAGMVIMAAEETNLRSAIAMAFRQGDHRNAWQMAETLRNYLERTQRLRERDGLVDWVKQQMPEDKGLDTATCAAIRQQAWSRFTQGQATEAIDMVKSLLTRLETEGLTDGSDKTFQLAMSSAYLGRIYLHASRYDLALAPLKKAITGFENFGESGRDNLSTALGDLANVYSFLGRLKEALKTAEQALTISRKQSNQREIARGLLQIANILMMQQRYTEANAHYTEALEAAQATGDVGLQGATLQHKGILIQCI